MDPLEHNSAISDQSSTARQSRLFALLIMLAQVAASILAYPFLPAQVPSHWNAAGQINGSMPRLAGVILYPLLSIGLYVLIYAFVAAGRRLGRTNQVTSLAFIHRSMPALLLFLLALQLTTFARALNFPVDVTFVIMLGLSLLLIYMGNYMGKLRRNFWAGIRTPWTLANDTVWERTHRLGGWLFVAVGLLGIIVSFVPAVSIRLWILIGSLMLVTLIVCSYSYVVYRRLEQHDDDELSSLLGRRER